MVAVCSWGQKRQSGRDWEVEVEREGVWLAGKEGDRTCVGVEEKSVGQ